MLYVHQDSNPRLDECQKHNKTHPRMPGNPRLNSRILAVNNQAGDAAKHIRHIRQR